MVNKSSRCDLPTIKTTKNLRGDFWSFANSYLYSRFVYNFVTIHGDNKIIQKRRFFTN